MRDDEVTNRGAWDRSSDAYQARHGATLERAPEAWGVWRIPEATLHALGDVAGLDMLELGCGAAQWSRALAARGARVTGLDLSATQLSHAAPWPDRGVALVQASATRTPFRSGTFDLVFCDHGAMSFADPFETVPEAARLLRPGGLLVSCITSPIAILCTDPGPDLLESRLFADWFGLRRITWPGDAPVEFQLPYGEWLQLFRRHGFAVEDLIHLRPPEHVTSSYRDDRDHAWARRWPLEDLWRVRKHPTR